MRSGARDERSSPQPPGAVPGMDAAGEVIEAGPDVDTGIAVHSQASAQGLAAVGTQANVKDPNTSPGVDHPIEEISLGELR